MYFKPSTHQYIIGDKPYTSFSSIIKLVEPIKDWDDIAIKYAKKHSTKKDPLTVEDVKKKWAEEGRTSREKGTLFHALKEEEDINSKDNPVYFSETVNDIKPIRDLETLEDGIYPELTLYNNEYQACGTADKVIIETIDGIRYASVLDYKGLSLDTPIPTKHGWKLMKEINEGDEIFDGEGNITKVEHVSNIHNNPCFKIVFDTNEEIICDNEHKWELSFTGRSRKNGIYLKNIVLTTQEIFNNFKNLKKTKLPRIKCTKLNLGDAVLPLDPYILGLWLGDGAKSGGKITCINNDIWDEIHKRGYKTSLDHCRFQERAETRTIYGISIVLRNLNLLNNKHIPDIYMRSSHAQRLDLLRGFMDSDGYYNRTRSRCVMATTQKWQADALADLVNSLGFKATIIKAFASGFGKKNIPKFDICFTPDENPFLIRNKDFKVKEGKASKESFFRKIKNIEVVETIPTKCITVCSPLQTYLFGKGYIKTHNTSKTIDEESYFNNRDQKHAMLSNPLQSVMDCNFMKYSLQLSMYAFFLEKYNFTPKDLVLVHLVVGELPKDKESKYKIEYEGKMFHVEHEIEYPVKYMKKEVKALLQYHKSKLK